MKTERIKNKRHLIAIENLTKNEFFSLLNNAFNLLEISARDIKKTPALRGKTIINFFCESSTRTRSSFEIAAKWLSADAINFSPSASSLTKGESLLDTAKTLQAMCPDIIVVRHKDAGVPAFLANYLKDTSIINAGDGMHEHPTQALLDCLSLMQHYNQGLEGIQGKTIAIVGDIVHSRVVRSNIFAHQLLGNEVRLIAPPTLLPREFRDSFPGVKIFSDLEQGLKGADIIMCLRLQLERQQEHFIPSLEEYTNQYFVSRKKLDALANSGYVVMHPGPINRGVEVETALIDSECSLVEKQVSCGLAVRMACLIDLCTYQEEVHAAN